MTSGESDLIDITADLRYETDSAFLIHDGTREAWVPKSLVENNGDGTFAIPEWLAYEKELI